MKLKNVSNGGTAEAGEELAKRLIASGSWVEAKAEKPKRSTRRTTKDTKES